MTCAFHLPVSADRDTVDDIDALGTNWEPPEEVEELVPGSHITVQVCELLIRLQPVVKPYFILCLLARYLFSRLVVFQLRIRIMFSASTSSGSG